MTARDLVLRGAGSQVFLGAFNDGETQSRNAFSPMCRVVSGSATWSEKSNGGARAELAGLDYGAGQPRGIRC